MPHDGKAFQWDRRRRHSLVSKCPCPCAQLSSRDAATESQTQECQRPPAARRARGTGPCPAGSHAALPRLWAELFVWSLSHLRYDTPEAPNYPELAYAPPERVPFPAARSPPTSNIKGEARSAASILLTLRQIAEVPGLLRELRISTKTR